jgi:hypothetical protein
VAGYLKAFRAADPVAPTQGIEVNGTSNKFAVIAMPAACKTFYQLTETELGTRNVAQTAANGNSVLTAALNSNACYYSAVPSTFTVGGTAGDVTAEEATTYNTMLVTGSGAATKIAYRLVIAAATVVTGATTTLNV